MRTNRLLAVMSLTLCSAACAQDRVEGGRAASPFPHLTINTDAKYIDIESHVPITLDDPDAPHVYLELIACTPDTKEHEVLVVTSAKPSHVHAALLLLGVEPGQPGAWEWEGDNLNSIPPSGDRIRVEFRYVDDDGQTVVASPQQWIVNLETGEHFPDGDWLFAGSRIIDWRGQEYYDADGAGTLIGLTTFGSEVLAWPTVISPESTIEEPIWIADKASVPVMDTPVTVRLSVVDSD